MSSQIHPTCAEARPLVAPYLDGELSEAQAGPLRRHLLDCAPCRATAQEGRALQRWFAQPRPLTAPPGFAARVARRAFAGDTGERAPAAPAAPLREGRLLQFVLRLTAAAALVLIGLSVASRLHELPAGEPLRAEDRPVLTSEEILRRLDQLEPQAPPVQPASAPVGAAAEGRARQ